jgi:hypothetical protein
MVSILLFLGTVFLAFRSLIKRLTGVAGSLIALLIFACVSYPFSVLPFLIVFVFLLAYQDCEMPTLSMVFACKIL